MKTENELSVFGWIVVLATIAGVIYWFSIPVSNANTVSNILNIIARIGILCVLGTCELRGLFNFKLIPQVKSVIANIILIFEVFAYNIDIFNQNTNSLVSLYSIAIVTIMAITFISTALLFCLSIDDYEDGYIVKETVKNFFEQNFFVNLMFKQPKYDKKEKM